MSFKLNPAIEHKILNTLNKGLDALGQEMVRNIKGEMGTAGSPNIISGNLLRSIEYNIHQNTLTVKSGTPYSAILEFGGTVKGAIHPAYPYMRPGIAKTKLEMFRDKI